MTHFSLNIFEPIPMWGNSLQFTSPLSGIQNIIMVIVLFTCFVYINPNAYPPISPRIKVGNFSCRVQYSSMRYENVRPMRMSIYIINIYLYFGLDIWIVASISMCVVPIYKKCHIFVSHLVYVLYK